MIGMKHKNRIQRLCQHWIDLVIFARHRKAHAQEIFRVAEIVARINEGLSDGVFVCHRSNGWRFRD